MELEVKIDSPSKERRRIENQKLKNEWNVCCSKSSKECIKYGSQMVVAVIVLAFSMIQIATTADEKEIYFSLISFILGVLFPHPTLDSKK